MTRRSSSILMHLYIYYCLLNKTTGNFDLDTDFGLGLGLALDLFAED